MIRRILIGVVLIGAFAAGSLLFRQGPVPQTDLEAAPSSPAPVQAVQVKHDFVVVPMPSPVNGTGSRSPREAPSLSVSASNRPSVSAPRPQPRRAAAPLLAKVGRAVAGDGRYRPEPFPRVK